MVDGPGPVLIRRIERASQPAPTHPDRTISMIDHATPDRLAPRLALAAALALACVSTGHASPSPPPDPGIFGRDNLIAWCIVPFDSKNRGPEERAAMLRKLGFKHFAYDWRPEHVATFDAEIEALKQEGVGLDAFWAPGELNADSRRILEVLKKHDVHAQLWAMLDVGNGPADAAEQARRVAAAAARLKPLAEAADRAGCTVALYNHGGWFGEPENQVAIIERLQRAGGRQRRDGLQPPPRPRASRRLRRRLRRMLPYLKALNINGMDPGGDRVGRKILPLGQGSEDLALLRTIRDSGYRGPIGILGHTQDDAEARLLDNLDGLDWLVPQLDGQPPGPRPTPRTPVTPRPASDPRRAEAAPRGRATPPSSPPCSPTPASAATRGSARPSSARPGTPA